MKNELMEIINPIIERSIKLIEDDNYEEMVGRVVILSKKIKESEDVTNMVELAVITLLHEIKEKKEEVKDV